MAPGKTRQIREKQRRSETGTMDPDKTRQIRENQRRSETGTMDPGKIRQIRDKFFFCLLITNTNCSVILTY